VVDNPRPPNSVATLTAYGTPNHIVTKNTGELTAHQKPIEAMTWASLGFW